MYIPCQRRGKGKVVALDEETEKRRGEGMEGYLRLTSGRWMGERGRCVLSASFPHRLACTHTRMRTDTHAQTQTNTLFSLFKRNFAVGVRCHLSLRGIWNFHLQRSSRHSSYSVKLPPAVEMLRALQHHQKALCKVQRAGMYPFTRLYLMLRESRLIGIQTIATWLPLHPSGRRTRPHVRTVEHLDNVGLRSKNITCSRCRSHIKFYLIGLHIYWFIRQGSHRSWSFWKVYSRQGKSGKLINTSDNWFWNI